MSLPTLADLKSELNITGTENDDEMLGKLDAAIDVVRGIVGEITPRTVTETHRNVASRTVLLRRTPVQSVVSVSARSYFGQPFVEQSADAYDLDSDAGTVFGYWYGGDVTVTYMVGRDDVPVSISQAVLIIAAHLWETQRRPGFTSDAPAGFGGADGIPDATMPMGMGYAIPSRARELLQPYMRPVIA